jgi:hypothetical protein
VCLLAVCAAVPVLADPWSKTFTVTGRAELHVKASAGNVAIRAGDAGEIRASLQSESSKTDRPTVLVTSHQNGDRAEIEIRVSDQPKSGGLHAPRLEIQVPPEAVVDVRTDDGHIQALGLKGETRLATKNGGIEGLQLEGSLEATTRDGKIRFSGRFYRLALHTHDGSIEGELRAGSCMLGSWTIETGRGHIRLGLPQDFGADLDAQSDDGDVKVEAFLFEVTGFQSTSEAHGKINGGGQALRIRSSEGTIHIDPVESK